MPHDTSLITTIVAALVLAYIFGAIAHRFKMPPLVGYLIAGVAVGPHSPGFIADQTLAPQLAEIGVILLMFGVGLHFSLRDLLSVRAVAVPGALLQMAVATALGVGLATMLGWSLGGGLVFGLALGVSSTVVLLKALQDRHLIDSDRGRIAVGWLIVEDLAMVLALVLIPALAGAMGGTPAAGAVGLPDAVHAGGGDPFVALAEQLLHRELPLWGVLAVTLAKLLAFVGFMIVVGRRIIPAILHATAHTGSRELFRLAVLAIALGVAAGAAYLFGVSLALGAFFAGMILSESQLSQRAAQETLPLRDAFGVLFFVSVGMLFDPAIFIKDPLPVIATLVIILFGKSIVGFLLLILFRRPVAAALTISASLAQIGEFSFILAALGVSLGLMPEEGRGLILAGAIFSIILNPLMFWLSERVRPRLEAKAARRAEPELGPVVPDSADAVAAPEPVAEDEVLEEVAQPTRLSNHVVLIGYGRVGSVVAAELAQEGAPFVLVEDAEGRVLAAREAGMEVIVGNAATRDALTLANVMGARCVVIAIPNAFEAGQATEQCRKLNAAVRIIARAHSDEEEGYLKRLGADEVIMGEREIGLGMIDWLKGDTRREKAVAQPRFSAGENLLQQARQAQPVAEGAVAAAGPVVFEPHEPILPPAAPAPAEPVEVTANAAAVTTTPVESEPAAASAPRLPAAKSIFSFGRRAAQPPASPVVAAPLVTAAALAVAAEAGSANADAAERDKAAAPVTEAATVPEAAPAAAAEPAVTPAPVVETARVDSVLHTSDDTIAADRFVFPDSRTTTSAAAPTEPPVEPETVQKAASTTTFTDAPELAIKPPPLRPATFEFPRRAESDAGDTEAVDAVETAASSVAPAAPAEAVQTAEAPVEFPSRPAADEAPVMAEPAASLEPAEPAVTPTMAEAPTSAEEPAAASAASGFRVVPPSDIFILPPDPSARAGSWGEAEAPVKEEPRPTFRSEFWDDPATDRQGESTFAGAVRSPQMRDVHASEAARAAVEDGSWMAALERDLFGDETPTSHQDPDPTPRPPQEDPAPAPQPIETPRPEEDPAPQPQPIVRPTPQEIPGTPPPAVPPVTPPTRAGGDQDEDGEVDALGRREPRLY